VSTYINVVSVTRNEHRQRGNDMTLSEAIRAIMNHRGPIAVDTRLFYNDMTWVEAKKGSLLEILKETMNEQNADGGDYDFDVFDGVGYFSANS
jgi:hypothetical protein